MKNAQVVSAYGTMWARNAANIKAIPYTATGVYILFDGSMPVYVGKGNIRDRIIKASRSIRRGQLWDHFSWYALGDPRTMHDIEVLILRMLPRYLRALTRQDGNFVKARRHQQDKKNRISDYITRKP